MSKNFFYISKFNFELFNKFLPKQRNNIILDYGCGNGIYPSSYKSSKVKKILLYDKNTNLKKFIINKYKKNKIFFWTSSLNVKYDIVLINSVVQYVSNDELKKLINFFKKKKVKKILISDIPKFPRILEATVLIFVNPKKFLLILKYIFNKNYHKTLFYFRKVNFFKKINNNYSIEIKKNLNDDHLLRYSVILSLKKYN